MSKHASPKVSAVPHDERRAHRRLSPDEVPWIKSVKPNAAEGARLLDISSTGMQLESGERLLPGRRSSILLVTDNDERERVEAVVVRTQLVALGREGEPVYRTALTFTKPLDLRIPEEPAQTAAAPSPQELRPRLEGPFTAVWETPSGPQQVEVTNVGESSCFVVTTLELAIDSPTTLTVWFSPTRELKLTAKVLALEPNEGCLLRFVDLPADARRALRVEIQGRASARRAAGARSRARLSTLDSAMPLGSLVVDWTTKSGGHQTNQW